MSKTDKEDSITQEDQIPKDIKEYLKNQKPKTLVDFYSDIMIKAGIELLDHFFKRFDDSLIGTLKQRSEEKKANVNTPKTPETIPKVELNITNGNSLKVFDIIVLDNSYKIKNEEGLVAFIGKSLVDSVDLNNNILTLKNTSKWLLEDKKDGTPNIKWSEDTYNG